MALSTRGCPAAGSREGRCPLHIPGWQWHLALAEKALGRPPQQHPGPQRQPPQPLELQDLSPQRPAKHSMWLPTMTPDAQPPPAVQEALQQNARLQRLPQLRLHRRSPRRTHFAASSAGGRQLPGQICSPEHPAGQSNLAHSQQQRQALLLSPEGVTPDRRAGLQGASMSGQASNSALPRPVAGPACDAQSSTRLAVQQASPIAGWRQWPVDREQAPVHLAQNPQGQSDRPPGDLPASERHRQPRWQVCQLTAALRGTVDAQPCCLATLFVQNGSACAWHQQPLLGPVSKKLKVVSPPQKA